VQPCNLCKAKDSRGATIYLITAQHLQTRHQREITCCALTRTCSEGGFEGIHPIVYSTTSVRQAKKCMYAWKSCGLAYETKMAHTYLCYLDNGEEVGERDSPAWIGEGSEQKGLH